MWEAHLGRESCTEDPWFLQWGFSRATGLKRLLRVYSRLAEPPLLLSDSEATFTRLCDLFCSHHYHCCCCSHHHHLLLLVAASDALHIPGSKSSDLFCRAPQLNSARIFYSAACLPNQGRSNQREREGEVVGALSYFSSSCQPINQSINLLLSPFWAAGDILNGGHTSNRETRKADGNGKRMCRFCTAEAARRRSARKKNMWGKLPSSCALALVFVLL